MESKSIAVHSVWECSASQKIIFKTLGFLVLCGGLLGVLLEAPRTFLKVFISFCILKS